MNKTLSRRELLSLRKSGTPTAKNKVPGDDPFFKKYANASMPFASLRTTTGLAPYTGPWTDTQIFHLLRRTTFGLTQQGVYILRGMSGAPEAVNFLMSVTQMPTTTPVNVYQNEYNDTQGCPYGASWVDFSVPDNGDSLLAFYRTEYSFKPWWYGQLINQNTDLLEKMTLFWSNHFGARTNEFNQPRAIWQHYHTLRTNALGNFRTIIKAITVDPHMLFVLNGFLNSAVAPDENYARELQELFTVGKGPDSHYTEDDVRAAARVLTGWRRTPNADGSFSSYFDDTQHDTSDKQFSAFYNNTVISGQAGANGQYETDALLDMILATDECAKYLVRCLYRWFVYYVIDDSEEQNVIAPLAKIFRDSNYEIAPVLQALFTSEHFFDPLNIGCIIKSPIDLFVGFNRELALAIPTTPVDLTYLYWRHFKVQADNAGQRIADPIDISGWAAYRQEPVYYEAWINSTTIQARTQSLNLYASTGNQLEPYNLIYIKIDSIAFNKQFSNPGDPNAVIANFTHFLLPADLSDAQKKSIKSILLNNPDVDNTPDYYWTNAWNAYIATPGNSSLELVVRQRLDALVYYITNLEEYQLY